MPATKDVTATSVNLQIVKVAKTGNVEARLVLLDEGGIALAGVVMDLKEFREMLRRFSASYRQVTGAPLLL